MLRTSSFTKPHRYLHMRSFFRRLRYDLNRNQAWQSLMSDLKSKYSEDVNNSRLNTSGPRVWSQFGNTGDAVATHSSLALGHPKLGKLRDMVLQHFKDKEKEKIATRFGYWIFTLRYFFYAIIY